MLSPQKESELCHWRPLFWGIKRPRVGSSPQKTGGKLQASQQLGASGCPSTTERNHLGANVTYCLGHGPSLETPETHHQWAAEEYRGGQCVSAGAQQAGKRSSKGGANQPGQLPPPPGDTVEVLRATQGPPSHLYKSSH